jgi:hypothetical protein
MSLQFSDGMLIKTDGPLRVIQKRDGFYVVGNGVCIPVNDFAEGEKIIVNLKKRGYEDSSK